ncbi:PIG-L family deacetylase [Paradesulfitobacterium aromaticivorans]
MRKRMLLVFAHPDDESFAMGGTIAKAASEGIEVVLFTATRGEEGKTAGLCRPEELGSVREQELRRAAEILGISRIEFLDYRDKDVATAPPMEILTKLVRILRQVRPQVVVTFGADGASGHRDHRAIHYWTKTAVYLAGQNIAPNWGEKYILPRLLYVQSWNRAEQGRQRIDFTVPMSAWAERKWQAVCAHKTQVFSRERFEKMPSQHKERYFSKEIFRCDRELSQNPGQGKDLFTGLKG